MPASTAEINPGPASQTTVNTQAVYSAQASTGSVSGNYAQGIVTAASTNDFTVGSGFPVGIGYLDINPTTNNVTLTGMVAGIQAQEIVIRNIGTTYTVLLSTGGNGLGDSASLAANRFVGQGDVALLPGAFQTAIYYSLPNPRWSIGG